MHVYLKMKIKSLAEEARLIRFEENYMRDRARYLRNHWRELTEQGKSLNSLQTDAWHQDRRQGLHEHRVHDVRDESRAALLAYGFLRGRPYAKIEAGCAEDPGPWNVARNNRWSRVRELVGKYGEGDQRVILQKLAEWVDSADAYTKAALERFEAKQREIKARRDLRAAVA